MATANATANKTDPLTVLTEPDAKGRWPHRFTVRGREFVRVPGGPFTMSFDDRLHGETGTFRVFNERGKTLDLTIRQRDQVVVLSYTLDGCTEHPPNF